MGRGIIMPNTMISFETWEPIYESILSDFGYDRSADETARDVFCQLLQGTEPLTIESLSLPGTVAICGAGPSLGDELSIVRSADTVIAASTAADILLELGVSVDCMVTDLDKNPDTVRRLTAQDVPVAVHAHGDNINALRTFVPSFSSEAVIPTTQTRPVGPIKNPGGFTDGDRAAFLAHAAGAQSLTFAGWDFDDPSVSAEKAKKLEWAERLLYWLETRRSETFLILDGRRDSINFPWES